VKRYYLLAMAMLLAAIGLVQRAQAQSPCPHVDFRLETTQSLDQEAICEAAEPWAEAGIQIFIFLTDERPSSETEWFERLDQVEAEAGLRDLGQPDNFNRNSLAFESSTSEASWANTITYGEALFGTRLDTDDAALNRVKSQLRNALQNGNPTGAFMQALEETYAINYPPPSPFLTGAIVIIILGIVGGAVALLYRPVIQPALQRTRRRRQLEGQLTILQKNVANLLLAGERLLNGSTPEETVLYQLFEAYGGRLYPERDTAVREWLRRSQAALRAAFDLRLSLESEEARKAQSLEQQVRNWEMIYLTLAGSSPRILELSNEALQDLLDPLVILEREEPEAQLVAQLNDIRRQIEGLPLKVALLVVNPSQTDQEGILGYIDQVEEQIAELMTAQQQAPEHLQEAKRERLEAEEEIASARPFGMTGSQILRGIDERLTQAESDLKKGVHLVVLQTAESIGRDLEIVADLVAAVAEHEGRQGKIAAIAGQGYRPTQLQIISQEIERDKQHIVQAIGEGDYMAADNWLDELDADSVRALAEAEAWRARHQANAEALAHLRQEIARAERQITSATDAWAMLRRYPEGNWANVTNGPEQAV
jgi:hypothetical protein